MAKIQDDLPFELWLTIFQSVYDSNLPVSDPNPDSKYLPSALQMRLNIHRHLSLVCRHFHELSSGVFFESLELITPIALHAVADIVKKNPRIADIVRNLSFSFHGYRCSTSSPPRQRMIRPDNTPPTNVLTLAQASERKRRSVEVALYTRYVPSMTKQPQASR